MMTAPSNSTPSISVEQRQLRALALACADACDAALQSRREHHPDAVDGMTIVDMVRGAAEHCRTLTGALESPDYDRAAVDTTCEAVSRVARDLPPLAGDDPELCRCADLAVQVATACTKLTARGPAYDKVVADTFPASDAPAR
jgi:hypothetical protein